MTTLVCSDHQRFLKNSLVKYMMFFDITHGYMAPWLLGLSMLIWFMSCRGVLATLPNGFTVTTTTDSLSVAWTTPGSGDVPANFNVDVSEGTTNKATCTSGDSSCEVSSGLSAGTGYLIKVTDSSTSTEYINTYYTEPNPPRSLQLKAALISTNTVTFQWQAPDQAASVTNYKYKVQKTGSTNTIEGTTTSLEKTVRGLEPGATYSVSIQATKNDAASSFTVLNDVTLVPNKPRNLRENTNNKATTSIEIQWDSPVSGVHSNYYIKWSKDGSKVNDASPTQSVQAISGLQPGQTYTVTVYAVSNGVRSVAESGTFSTSLDAAKPGFKSKTTRTLTISWGDPADTDFSHYIVYTTPDGGPQGTQNRVETSTDKTYSYQFTGLIPGETYTSTVVVHSTGGHTQSAERTDTTYPDQCVYGLCRNGAVCVDQNADFLCVCTDGFTGIRCETSVPVSPVIDTREVTSYPDKGPQAGGTKLTITIISGMQKIQGVFLQLPVSGRSLECQLNRSDSRVAVVWTPPHNESISAVIVAVILPTQGDTTSWNTGRVFSYKPNPGIMGIQPNTTLVKGGTKLTVSGTSIDAVAAPKIKYGVLNCKIINETSVFEEPCNVSNSETMYCLTPDLTVCVSPSRQKRDTSSPDDEIQFRLTILGFILDGDDKYDDLKKHKDLLSQIGAFGPPDIPSMEESIQYRRGLILQIKGDNMDRGATAGDYTVHVGKGVCVVGDTHLTESVLFCQTPGPIPDKSEGNKDKSHRIVIRLGNYDYEYGKLWYPWWFDNTIIIPAACAGAVVLLICILAPTIVHMRRKHTTKQTDHHDRRRSSMISLPPVMTEDQEETHGMGLVYLPPVKSHSLSYINQ